jgi:hypothetical protein
VTDDIYKDRYDYEALDIEAVSRGIRKTFRIMCIPFITYGINKGDIVTLKGGVISRVITDDGQYGYRIAYPDFASDEMAHKSIDKILTHLRDESFEVEEFNHKISAVNAINSTDAVKLEKILNELIAQKRILGFDMIR